MTDPERISQRSSGLAAQLLQAGGAEQPAAAGMQRTLAALGVSGAALTTAAAAHAAVASGAKASSAALGGAAAGTTALGAGVSSGSKVVTATLLVKWLGAGVLGGVALSGAAALVSTPAPVVSAPVPARAPVAKLAPSAAEPPRVTPAREASAPLAVASVPAPAAVAPSPPPATRAAPEDVVLEVGAPLAAEVAFIDGARALLAAGQAEPGLAQLRRYEQEFPEARLLPEVLFLRMETCERLGRSSEARVAATRLVEGFPRSPHAARARQLLGR